MDGISNLGNMCSIELSFPSRWWSLDEDQRYKRCFERVDRTDYHGVFREAEKIKY